MDPPPGKTAWRTQTPDAQHPMPDEPPISPVRNPTSPHPVPPPSGWRGPESLALGDFRLVSKVGGGTQGAAYRARQLSRDRTVALKLLTGTAAYRPAAAARFARESALLARLDHPGIVHCHGFGDEGGFRFFAMEFVDGSSVKSLLGRAGGAFSPAAAVFLARQCAEALAHAAARGVVHRDVKPGNLLVGPGGTAKLIDWGLARPADADTNLTAEHCVLGTLRYAPPEQFRDARRADRRSDIYALGGTLYEMLTGRLPFPGEQWPEVLRAKDAGVFPPAGTLNPAVPPRLDRVLTRMLAPDPIARYPDYGPLIRDLAAIGFPDEPLDSAALVGTGAEPSAATSARLRVLVVYDDPKYVTLTQHALLAAGVPYDLTTVEDGRDAPAAVARNRRAGWMLEPDAVLLGLTSPTETSMKVLTEVRRGPLRQPALWMSRSPDGAAVLRGLGLGVGVWATSFGDLEPLATALQEIYTAVAGDGSEPR